MPRPQSATEAVINSIAAGEWSSGGFGRQGTLENALDAGRVARGALKSLLAAASQGTHFASPTTSAAWRAQIACARVDRPRE